VIRAALAAIFLVTSAVRASPHRRPSIPEPPAPPEPPDPPEAPRAPRAPSVPAVPDLDIDVDISVPDIDIRLPEIVLPALPGLLMARGHERGHDPADDDDDDDDRDDQDNDQGDHNDQGVHIYKMTPQAPRIHVPRVRVRSDDDEDWDERDATAQARGRGSVTLPVKGPVTLQVRVQNGDITVATAAGSQVRMTLEDSSDQDVALYAFGDRVQPVFRGRRTLRHGKLRVELPPGSRLDLSSMSGDLQASKLSEVRVRSMSGEVKLASVAKADIQTISGDVRIDEATGPVRLHTVSGHAVVSTEGAPQIDFQSASGDMDWTGTCAKDCHLNAETVSGELRFAVDPKSSFQLSYTSHSGELRDGLNLEVKRSPRRKNAFSQGFSGGWLEGSYGRGEGVIDADAFSGNLTLKKK